MPAATLPAVVGGHWESIGFQGLDPGTDLNRSMKMLTILQVSFVSLIDSLHSTYFVHVPFIFVFIFF